MLEGTWGVDTKDLAFLPHVGQSGKVVYRSPAYHWPGEVKIDPGGGGCIETYDVLMGVLVSEVVRICSIQNPGSREGQLFLVEHASDIGDEYKVDEGSMNFDREPGVDRDSRTGIEATDDGIPLDLEADGCIIEMADFPYDVEVVRKAVWMNSSDFIPFSLDTEYE